jgi:hypothetical protein
MAERQNCRVVLVSRGAEVGAFFFLGKGGGRLSLTSDDVLMWMDMQIKWLHCPCPSYYICRVSIYPIFYCGWDETGFILQFCSVM